MPDSVFPVWVALPAGERTVLKSFSTRKGASDYVERITKQPLSDDGRDVCLSHAQVLGIDAVWITELRVSKD